MVELLSPAGTYEKMITAFNFGADAVYVSGQRFGLRAFAGNFTAEQLQDACKYAHSLNKKIYVTLNILAHERDFDGLKEYVEFLNKIKVDAVIVADVGIIQFIKKTAPNLEIHVSTQANCLNSYSINFFANMGVKRIVLARELSISEIKEIRSKIPDNIDLEAFVHGAMCISYSGRCLLSNYFCNRDSNHGACVQACRWQYGIRKFEEKNGEYYPIEEDENGTYILNSKDMNMIEHLDKLIDAGITSFKIEGRMKSEYYVANVTNAYRKAIDLYYKNPTHYSIPSELKDELVKSSHRNYTTGFYFGSNDKECLQSSLPVATHEFIAQVLEDAQDGKVLVEQRNRFAINETLEVLSKYETFNKKFTVKKMEDLEGNEVLIANKVQQKLYLYTNLNLKKGDFLRREIVKKTN